MRLVRGLFAFGLIVFLGIAGCEPGDGEQPAPPTTPVPVPSASD